MTTDSARGELPLHGFDEQLMASGPAGFAMGSFAELAPFSYAAFPHRHEFYELLFVTGGSGTHVIDFVPYDVRPVTLYLVAPRQVQFWECRTSPDGYLVLFMEDFLPTRYGERGGGGDNTMLTPLGAGPALRSPPEKVTTISTLLEAMEREYRRDGDCDESVLQAYLHVLIVEMRRMQRIAAAPAADDRATVLATRFRRLVSELILTEQTVRGYADRIGVTAKHLADVVRKATGRTPAEIIREALTVEAKRLLVHTELTVAQVADALAFDNPSYFGRFFKREVGISPGEFRRRRWIGWPDGATTGP
ncbi:helix-turn-helix domain-containing protein [Pseudonocardia acaciae]|uniref:helix-turn-helix domain-containing protein n=1 Tax=Pseudonocardia acaciae TaxID=551276 RepID=UPI0006856F6F|nr:AraC family transcriptional regulator [Pseudonocardia acaciae]